VSATGDAQDAVRLLAAAGSTLAVAESLTGGTVAAAVVAVPGASAVLRGGVVAYATDLKARLLDVPAALLAEHGAVHPDVAVAMAAGVRARLGATWGVATTGVAGPDPQDGRPPGEYHVAVAGPGGDVVRSFGPGGPASRAEIRVAARDAVLALLVEVLRAG
jgi:nicotinamide-nucleotide amidase